MRHLLVFTLFMPAIALATTATEDATADATVYENVPDTNFGGQQVLTVKMQNGALAVTFIEFDVSSYMGQTLNSATLYLYCWNNTATNDTLWYAAVSEYWGEMSVTWNNRPGVISGTQVTAPYPSGTGWWSCDVTNIVQSWLNSAYSNNGFALYDVDGSDAKVDFNSREYASENPYLELDYGTSVESSSLGGIKAAFR